MDPQSTEAIANSKLINQITDKMEQLMHREANLKGIGVLCKVLPFATGAFDALLQGAASEQEQMMYAKFAQNADIYIQKINALIRAGEATNNEELLQAANNVYERLNEEMENQFAAYFINVGGDTASALIENTAGAAIDVGIDVVLDIATKKIPFPPIIAGLNLAGTVADIALDWGSAYESAISLQNAGLMNTIIKSDIAEMFEQDGEAAYQLTELYTELQIEGLKRTGQFLQDYEYARGLEVDEFGINDAQLTETLNGLDRKIEQMEDIQRDLYDTYYAEWTSTAQ